MQNDKLNTGQKESALAVGSNQDTSVPTSEVLDSSARPLKDISKYSTAGIGFQDVVSDLNKSWRRRKISSLYLSEAYRAIGALHCASDPLGIAQLPNGIDPFLRSARVRECSTYLAFAGPARDQLHLAYANFCRDRLCPQCAKRRSLKVFAQTSAVMDYLQDHFPGYQYVFLTVTVANCSSEDLPSAIDQIQDGWRWLYHESGYFRRKHRSDPDPVFLGSFRSLEVKRADDGVNWHPHLHIICAVESSYFHSDRYLDTRGLVKLWQRACCLDYRPICDIRACRPVRDPASGTVSYRDAVAEVSKYVFKFRPDGFSISGVYTLLVSLHNRRLCSYTGCFLKARQALALDDPMTGDLVNVDTQLRPDVADLVFKFGWRCGVYVLLDDFDQVKD